MKLANAVPKLSLSKQRVNKELSQDVLDQLKQLLKSRALFISIGRIC